MIEETPDPRTRIRTIIVFSLLFAVFAAVVLFGYWTTFSRPTTTIIVVRHAEQIIDPGNSNPELTPIGQARSLELARVLANAGINAIFATRNGCTQQTVQPLSKALNVPITQVDVKDTQELIRQIDQHRGETILVSGHSNTVPGIIRGSGWRTSTRHCPKRIRQPLRAFNLPLWKSKGDTAEVRSARRAINVRRHAKGFAQNS